MRGRIETAFRTTCRWVDRVERLALAALVTGMVGLSSLQILLRNVWHTGLIWAEPLLGMALLWLTMLGALAAAGLGRHLSIDLVAALASKRVSVWITRATSGLAAAICVLLAWAAGRYVGFQREMDSTALLGWPLWKYDLIIPVVFWLMAFRLAVRAVIPLSWLEFKTDPGLPGEGRTPT